MKPLLENWREYLRETIVDFAQYKPKPGMHDLEKLMGTAKER